MWSVLSRCHLDEVKGVQSRRSRRRAILASGFTGEVEGCDLGAFRSRSRTTIWVRGDLGAIRSRTAILASVSLCAWVWKWFGFDEFDWIWWIFFGWVLFLCLFIEKLYYKFVWKLRKCEEQIIFWNATKHLKIFPFPKIAFPENILHEPNTA